MTLKIATWNINSLRLRAPHIKNIDADIICIQEMKCQNHEVPAVAMAEHGFVHQYVRGEKAYNGVGIFSRIPLTDVEMLDFGGNSQARHISARLPNGTRLHNFYVPAGGDEPDLEINPSYAHKLRFVEDMVEYFLPTLPSSSPRKREEDTQKISPPFTGWIKGGNNSHIIVGDLNIAPFEHDVWSSKQLRNVISHTPPERERMQQLYATRSWVDVARHFVPHTEKCYSWWSYRNRDWEKSNRGRRLDHIWVTPDLQDKLVGFEILRHARNWEKPSDHVPVVVGMAL